MERLSEDIISQGSVVILPFPFSDLQRKKARPAIVVSNNRYNRYSDDVVAIPLTSNLRPSKYGVPVTRRDMESGKLVVDSIARVDKIFSVEKKIVIKRIGKIDSKTYLVIRRSISALAK